MLSDANWWSKRLKIKDLRDFEHVQIAAGNVTQGVSSEV